MPSFPGSVKTPSCGASKPIFMVSAMAAPGTRMAIAATVEKKCFFIGFSSLKLPALWRHSHPHQVTSRGLPRPSVHYARRFLLRRFGLPTLKNCAAQADAGRCRHISLRLFLRFILLLQAGDRRTGRAGLFLLVADQCSRLMKRRRLARSFPPAFWAARPPPARPTLIAAMVMTTERLESANSQPGVSRFGTRP